MRSQMASRGSKGHSPYAEEVCGGPLPIMQGTTALGRIGTSDD